MEFENRKFIKPKHLNSNGFLFGGQLLLWIDEEASMFAKKKLEKNLKLATKIISEINFISSVKKGEIIELGFELIKFGNTSIQLKCVVRNMFSHQEIISIDKIILVSIDDEGKSMPHGKGKNN